MDKTTRHITQILNEGSGSLGCLMLSLPIYDSLEIQKWVNENVSKECIITQEHEIHITVLYGIKNTPSAKIKEFIDTLKPIPFELKNIGLFKQDDQDVLKVDVESPELIEINKKLVDFLGEKGYQKGEYDYHPHLTLAYIKSNSCNNLEGHSRFNGSAYLIDKLIYSEPESTCKHEFNI